MIRFRKKLIGSIGLAAIAASSVAGVIAPPGVPVVGAATTVDLTFLNINDFHGRIDDNTVKFAGTIEQLRVAGGGDDLVALLSAGDNIGASLFESAVAQDQPTIDVLNALDLKASAVGNHEFDAGFSDLTDRVINNPDPAKQADWAYLGANVYLKGTTTPALDEYELFTLNTGDPVTVAVIGVVTSETPSLVSPAGVATLDFGDPVEAVNRVAAELTDGIDDPGVNDEADIIIAEFHEGAGAGLAEGATFEEEVAEGGPFAEIVNDTSAAVDVIFTGHTHKRYAWDAPVPGQPGKTRPIVQTGSYGEYIGKVVLTVDPSESGTPVQAYTATNVARVAPVAPQTSSQLDAALIAAHPRVDAVNTIRLASKAYADVIGSQVIGSVSADITTAFSGGSTATGVYVGGSRDDRSKESTLGNLVADSMVETLSAPALGGAEIGVVNPGGLRNELRSTPDPSITYAEANAVLPFANSLFTITLTGAQFKTMLEQQWQRLPNGTVPQRPYLQLGLSSNVSYTFDAALPEGSRITSIMVDGAPIDPAGEYRIGSFSFLVEGGDNFHVFKEGTDKQDSGLIDRDAWIEFLDDNSPVAPDFARRAVAVSKLPTTVTPGGTLAFGVSGLDLTSLGSPVNTTLTASIGGVTIGSVPVIAGAATVNLAVPAVPTGSQQLVLTAQPSGTTLRIPVTITPALTGITPSRLFDTRPGQSPAALRTVAKEQIGGAKILEVKATDLAGLVPATGVGAVSLNVAITNPAGAGFLTVYPCGERRLVASVNFVAGETVSNSVIAPVSATGTVCFYSNVLTDVVVDINGWFPVGSAFTATPPDRLFDTRPGESPAALRTVAKEQIGGTKILEVKATDLAGVVPATGVGAVSFNVAITNPTAAGFLTVYPCGERKLVASVNFTAGETVSNSVIAPVSSTGTVCFFSNVPTDVVVDVNGWFAEDSDYQAVGPDRLFDTRPGESPDARRVVAKAQVGGSYVLEVRVTKITGLTPTSGVSAVSLNVAATGSAAGGFVTVYPCGERNFVANVNYAAGQTVSNAVLAPVSADGTVCFYAQTPVDIVVDINGYFVGQPA